jgi:hypothetical protein
LENKQNLPHSQPAADINIVAKNKNKKLFSKKITGIKIESNIAAVTMR